LFVPAVLRGVEASREHGAAASDKARRGRSSITPSSRAQRVLTHSGAMSGGCVSEVATGRLACGWREESQS
jgi:hypothetical protein